MLAELASQRARVLGEDVIPQIVGGVGLIFALIAHEFDPQMSDLFMFLECGSLGGLIVTLITFPSESFMFDLDVSFHVGFTGKR